MRRRWCAHFPCVPLFLPHPPRASPTVPNGLVRACIDRGETLTSRQEQRTLFGGDGFRRGSAPNLAQLFTLDVCGRSVALLAMCFDCLVHRTFLARSQRISAISSRVSLFDPAYQLGLIILILDNSFSLI